jgi:trk system potassium uptake protein TrkA
VEFLAGSGANPDVLRRAGVERCELLIAAAQLDEVNIVACALGSKLGAQRTICFATREDLLVGGAGGLSGYFGIDEIIWPEAALAADIERVIMAPGATDAEMFAGGRIEMLEYRLDAVSPLVGPPVASLDLPAGVVIIAVKHEHSTSIPRGETRLEAGDKVVLMGNREGMAQLRTLMAPGAGDAASQLVTIIGGGDVGYRLAQHLDRADGIRVCVIERDPARGELLAAKLGRALILQGDGTDLELLESEDIGRSDVLVSVIDNDERNLLASLLGRQLGVGKVITRVSKPANHRLFERVGIDVALSAHGAAVTSVVHQIDGGRASLLAILQEGQARVVELTTPAGFLPTAVKDLRLPRDSIIGTVLRAGEVLVPRGDHRIEGGDRLLVCCTEAAVRGVRDLFAHG